MQSTDHSLDCYVHCTPVVANPSIAIDLSIFGTFPVDPEKKNKKKNHQIPSNLFGVCVCVCVCVVRGARGLACV